MTTLSNFEQRWRSLAPRGIRPGLQTLQEVLRALGSPHQGLPSVLIGGTNGKGSTAALVASMANAAGYRVGLFTSPYLQQPEEQVRIGPDPISPSLLTGLWDEVVDASERRCPGRLTAFEALTAAALLHFKRHDVDLAICEVGMGGRLDSTNVLDPIVSAITSLGLDHAAFLGDSVQQVAGHKAGIFRPGRPALLAPGLDMTAETLLIDAAREIGALPKMLSQDTRLHPAHNDADGSQRVTVHTPDSRYTVQLSLAGSHQLSNLTVALRLAEELRTAGWTRLNTEAIEGGTAACRWPGRLERFAVDGRTVLLDAAHNVQAAEALALHLRKLGVPFEVLFGALGDKDISPMLSALHEAHRLWLTQPQSDRTWDADAWRRRIDHPHVLGPWPMNEALQQSLGGSRHNPRSWLVVTGSLRLVGDVRTLLVDHYGLSPDTQNRTDLRP